MLFEDVFDAIGPFGTYQKRMFLLISLTGVPTCLHMLITVFILATPEHRCVGSVIANDTLNDQHLWRSDDTKGGFQQTLQNDTLLSQCYVNGNSNETNSAVVGCLSWVYSKEYFTETVVSQFNLVCDHKDKVTLSKSVMMSGVLAGSLVLGCLSDIIGRRKTMLLGFIAQFCVALGTAFVQTFQAFMILRFFTTFFGIGFFMAAFVAGIELVGAKQRVLAGMAIEIFWSVGTFLLLLLSYLIRDWKYLQISVACCNLLYFGHFILIPESARWLASKGKLKQASNVIRKAAKVNKANVSEKILSLQDLQLEGQQRNIYHMLFSPTLLIRSIVIFYNWAVVSMVYYGLSLNVGNLSGNLWANFLYASLAEMLSYIFCIFALYHFGRRTLHCCMMIVGGLACVMMIFPLMYGTEDIQWITVLLSVIGKFGISAAFAIIYIFTAELFPTSVRNSGLGISSVFARMGGIASPFIANLRPLSASGFSMALPYLIFGGLSITAGLSALILPETLNKKLPETIEDAIHFGREPKAPTESTHSLTTSETIQKKKSHAALE